MIFIDGSFKDLISDPDDYLYQPSDAIDGKILLTNFASFDADIYCETIRRFNESNHTELNEVFQIKSKAYDIMDKLVPNSNALFVTIDTSHRLVEKFWKIFDKVKKEYRNKEDLKSTLEEISDYLEGNWHDGKN